MNSQPEFKCECFFGHVQLRDWFELADDGETLIGMGSATSYDREGNLVNHKVSPTGVSMRFA